MIPNSLLQLEQDLIIPEINSAVILLPVKVKFSEVAVQRYGCMLFCCCTTLSRLAATLSRFNGELYY